MNNPMELVLSRVAPGKAGISGKLSPAEGGTGFQQHYARNRWLWDVCTALAFNLFWVLHWSKFLETAWCRKELPGYDGLLSSWQDFPCTSPAPTRWGFVLRQPARVYCQGYFQLPLSELYAQVLFVVTFPAWLALAVVGRGAYRSYPWLRIACVWAGRVNPKAVSLATALWLGPGTPLPSYITIYLTSEWYLMVWQACQLQMPWRVQAIMSAADTALSVALCVLASARSPETPLMAQALLSLLGAGLSIVFAWRLQVHAEKSWILLQQQQAVDAAARALQLTPARPAAAVAGAAAGTSSSTARKSMEAGSRTKPPSPRRSREGQRKQEAVTAVTAAAAPVTAVTAPKEPQLLTFVPVMGPLGSLSTLPGLDSPVAGIARSGSKGGAAAAAATGGAGANNLGSASLASVAGGAPRGGSGGVMQQEAAVVASLRSVRSAVHQAVTQPYQRRVAPPAQRISLKIAGGGVEPEHLDPTLVASTARALAEHGLLVTSMVVRAGCVELHLELADLAAVSDGAAGATSSMEVMVQHLLKAVDLASLAQAARKGGEAGSEGSGASMEICVRAQVGECIQDLVFKIAAAADGTAKAELVSAQPVTAGSAPSLSDMCADMEYANGTPATAVTAAATASPNGEKKRKSFKLTEIEPVTDGNGVTAAVATAATAAPRPQLHAVLPLCVAADGSSAATADKRRGSSSNLLGTAGSSLWALVSTQDTQAASLAAAQQAGGAAPLQLVVLGSGLDPPGAPAPGHRFMLHCGGRILDTSEQPGLADAQAVRRASTSSLPLTTSPSGLDAACANAHTAAGAAAAAVDGLLGYETCVLAVSAGAATAAPAARELRLTPGSLALEMVKDGMVLARTAALVAPTAAMAAEVNEALTEPLTAALAAGDDAGAQSVRELLHDLGLWLRYAAAHSAAAAAGGAPAAAASGAGSSNSSEWWRDNEAAVSAELRAAPHADQLLAVAWDLLQHALNQGMPHTAATIAQGIVTVVTAQQGVTAAVTAPRPAVTLPALAVAARAAGAVTAADVQAVAGMVLQAACLSRCSRTVDAAVGMLGCTASKSEGVWRYTVLSDTHTVHMSALHILAALPDGGDLISHALTAHAGARTAWATAEKLAVQQRQQDVSLSQLAETAGCLAAVRAALTASAPHRRLLAAASRLLSQLYHGLLRRPVTGASCMEDSEDCDDDEEEEEAAVPAQAVTRDTQHQGQVRPATAAEPAVTQADWHSLSDLDHLPEGEPLESASMADMEDASLAAVTALTPPVSAALSKLLQPLVSQGVSAEAYRGAVAATLLSRKAQAVTALDAAGKQKSLRSFMDVTAVSSATSTQCSTVTVASSVTTTSACTTVPTSGSHGPSSSCDMVKAAVTRLSSGSARAPSSSCDAADAGPSCSGSRGCVASTKGAANRSALKHNDKRAQQCGTGGGGGSSAGCDGRLRLIWARLTQARQVVPFTVLWSGFKSAHSEGRYRRRCARSLAPALRVYLLLNQVFGAVVVLRTLLEPDTPATRLGTPWGVLHASSPSTLSLAQPSRWYKLQQAVPPTVWTSGFALTAWALRRGAPFVAHREALAVATALARIACKVIIGAGLPCTRVLRIVVVCWIDWWTEAVLPALLEPMRLRWAAPLYLADALTVAAMYCRMRVAASVGEALLRGLVRNGLGLALMCALEWHARARFLAAESEAKP